MWEVAENYFNNTQKYNCNIIYIRQRFMSVSQDVRSSANFIIGFNQQKGILIIFTMTYHPDILINKTLKG